MNSKKVHPSQLRMACKDTISTIDNHNTIHYEKRQSVCGNIFNRFQITFNVSEGHFPREKIRSLRERRIMQDKLQRMPDTSIFPSSHVVINKERIKHYLPLMKRCGTLDEIARNHAKLMSEEGKVIKNLEIENSEAAFGLNVYRGSTIREVQEKFMRCKQTKNNILNKNYDKMGIGTIQDSKRRLYVCQVFASSDIIASNKNESKNK